MSRGAPGREGVDARFASLVTQYGLDGAVESKVRILVDQLANDPLAPTTIHDPEEIVDQHLADSLVALELDAVRDAKLALDLGSGAGLPGLPLAAALPQSAFVLLESSARKCAFLERATAVCGISNVRVVHARAESYDEERGSHDLVTARAVARLDVTAEYAAPLLRVGGTLVVWLGKRVPASEAAAQRAAIELGLEGPHVIEVHPFLGALHRHLCLMLKVKETPSRFPRRPGVALKRPLGAERRAPV